MLRRIVFALALSLAPLAAVAQGISGGLGDQGVSGRNIASQGFSGSGGMSPFLTLDGTAPVIYADFTTEGTTNNYYLNGTPSANFAAWMTAIGGTFSRAGSATYFQGGVLKTATTGVARFPTNLTGTPLGIRLTPANTNTVLQSNGFLTTWTLAAGAAPVQNVTGPDGGANTAWTFTAAAGAGVSLTQAVVITTPQFFSIFAKGGTSCFVSIAETDAGGTKTTWFNVCTGVVGTTNSTTAGAPTLVQATPSLIQLANGWWLVGISSSGASTVSIAVTQSDADASAASTTGNTLSAFGSMGTHVVYQADYIPTTTVTVTQAADSLISTVAWYSAATNTTFVDFVIDNPGTTAPGLVAIFDTGVFANFLELEGATTGSLAVVKSGNVTQWTSVSGAAVVAGTRTKAAIALAASNFAYSKAGANPFVTQASGAVPVAPTRLQLGADAVGQAASGNFRQLGFWGIRGSNAGIQAITQ